MSTLLGTLGSGLAYLLIVLLYLAGIGIVFGLIDRFLPRRDKI